MEFMPLEKDGVRKSFEDLFNIDGALRNVLAISAYTDLDSVKELVKFVRNGADSRSKPSLKIFIDKSSSRCSDKETFKAYNAQNKKIKSFCDDQSGIYLVSGWPLFHSKAFLVEGNRASRILIGSLNLTQRGMKLNEEIVLCYDFKTNDRSQASKLANEIKNYSANIMRKSVPLDEAFNVGKVGSLRELLLDGVVCHELRDSDPFRFDLALPKELVPSKSIDVLLEAESVGTLSVKSLITGKMPIGLGVNLPDLNSKRGQWKKYCVETCYGFWCPTYFRHSLKLAIDMRSSERSPHFDEIKTILNTRQDEIRKCFLDFCCRVDAVINREKLTCTWKFSDQAYAAKIWDDWVIRLAKKLENPSFKQRLVDGIAMPPTPDLWSDPISSKLFEDSFCDGLIYCWSKEYSRSSSNIIAKTIADKLDLDDEAKDDIDGPQLVELILGWYNDHHGSQLFEIEE